MSPGAAAVMATHDPSSEKPALRRLARARRDAVPAADRAAAAAAAAALIDARVLAPLPPGATIALYAAMRSELPSEALAAAAIARGLVIAYPRAVADHTLQFHRATPAELAPGRFGIPEPSPDAAEIALDELAIIVVPALLFDRDGYRLGWGGGWYDGTLARTRALRVGLAFEHQLVDELPRAAHDQPVDLVATEVAVHPCRTAGRARDPH